MAEFDDPFKPPPDATVMRPRPGAGRRPSGEPAPRAPLPAPAPRVEPIPDAAREFLGAGLNPLIQAASPLLLLAGQLRGTLSAPDIGSFRRHVLEEIRLFEERARAARISNEVVLAARYALCAALDEAVLSTPWGAQSEWGQQTLLVALHREAWGGEKFFDMLDKIAQDPEKHIDLMELQYLCIAFGFAGKYQVRELGHARLAEVQQEIYRRIREYRGVPRPELSLRWEGVKDRRNPLIRYVPWWVVGSAMLVILTIAFVTYGLLLREETRPVKLELAKLRGEAFNTPAGAPPSGPTLGSLLPNEIASGEIALSEDGAKTTIIVSPQDFFASGSADVNKRYVDLLLKIGAAINQVPGRVEIVGYTDSQPVHTVRFSDNIELSEARAESVSAILQRAVANPARLTAYGLGDSKIIDRVNLAKNRRVEIIHVHRVLSHPMLSFLKKRAVLIVLGFILLAIFIWWALGYLSPVVRGYQLDAYPVRFIIIGVVIGLWALVLLVKRLRAKQAGQKLMAAVVRQSESAKERPSAEALQLRERFEEAVATLGARKRGRHSLYDLPWYIIIGAPGSGKTTALVNSGLHFPVDQRTGRGALRGVGGTRNCDWWFTDEAVFLDTAGRYTTQDSDAGSDSAAWGEFLALLRKYRQRRPVNGVLVAMSAQDLMVQGHAAREEHVAAVRRRLEELNAQFGIQLPVYLLITKCDLVAGFTEYFDDLTQEGRAQVWGVTFPYEVTRNSDAAATFPEEFDALVQRLNERAFGRVQDVGDPRRRARAFGFPQQIAALRGPLSEFIAEVFRSTKFDKTILLRGIYFTSGTQEGTPIDRLLGAIGRRFSVAPDAVAPAGRGKAYFIERLLQEVVIPEAGLAGVNRRLELRKAASQLGAYAAMIAVAALGVLALSLSYGRNASYIREVEAAIGDLRKAPPVPESASVELMLPQLNAVEHVFEVANEHEAAVPWSMRWGLYQGGALGEAARSAYVDALSGPLLTRVAERFRQRINGYASDPSTLYLYLKGYLILLQPPEHPRADAGDVEHLRALARQEWKDPSASEAETGPLMLRHFNNLLEQSRQLRQIPRSDETDTLIASARSSVREASIARLAYLHLHQVSEQDAAAGLRLDTAAGVGSGEVLRRKDNVPLSTPVLSLYTKKGFEQVAAEGAITDLVATLAKEQWVWGQDMPKRTSAQLEGELFDIYEKDYIGQWERILAALDTRPPSSPTQAATSLERLAGALRNFYRTVDAQTFLVQPEAPKAEGGLASLAKKAEQFATPVLGGAKVSRADMARARITARFDEIHKLVAGEAAAPIERALGPMGQLKEKLQKVGPDVGKNSPADAGTQRDIGDATRAMKEAAASLPPAVGAVVNDVAGRVESVVLQGVRGDLVKQYAEAVGSKCRELVEDRYPLNRTAPMDVTPADFSQVFGYGGFFDKFFSTTLEPMVDVTQRPWVWRPTLGNAPAGPEWMLRRVENALRIRDNFFRFGSQMLEWNITVSPVELDARVIKFTLQIDGQTLAYQHGPVVSQTMKWPGAVGEAVVTFADKSPVATSIAYVDKKWALFHLIDNATKVEDESETRHVFTFAKNGLSARVLFEFDSTRNPFYKRDLVQQFRCGA